MLTFYEDEYIDKKVGYMCTYLVGKCNKFYLHNHRYYEFFLTCGDNFRHVINGKEIPLDVGTLVFVRPDDVHTYKQDDKIDYDIINIAYSSEIITQAFMYMGESFPASRLIHSKMPPSVILGDEERENLKAKLVALITDDNIKSKKINSRALLIEILSTFFSDMGEKVENDKKNQIPHWFLDCLYSIKNEMIFNMSFSEIAKMTNYSESHLRHCFKKYLNQTPSQYITEQRLAYIAGMLINTNVSVATLCYESGFNNLSWFYRLFQQKYKMTPLEYREKFGYSIKY